MSKELDILDCSLRGRHLIEASAGSGKTWNLCALFLRLLLEESVPVERILVVTFTKAATAELKDRIRARLLESDDFMRALSARLADRGLDAHEQRVRLDDALARFDEAAIHTIHGFCQRALSDSPLTAKQALQLELIQDDSPVLEQAVADFWREHVLSPTAPEALLQHILLQGVEPSILREDLVQVMARPTAHVLWPETASDSVQRDFPEEEQECSPNLAAPLCNLESQFLALRMSWAHQRQAWLSALNADRPALNASVFGANKAKLDDSIDAWDRWLSQRSATQPPPDAKRIKALSRLTAEGYRINKGHRRMLGEEWLVEAGALLDRLRTYLAYGERLWLRLRQQATRELPQRVAKLKAQAHELGFNDMLSRLHDRLQTEEHDGLVMQLRSRYDAALIDEFQDTDPLQFEIFDRIFSAPRSRLFFLGDPKQAIYSFRNADIQTYLRARSTVDQTHTLEVNQRSCPTLIQALNQVFSRTSKAFLLPGLNYVPVRPGARIKSTWIDHREHLSIDQRGPSTAPLVLWRLPGPDPESMLTRRSAERLCAQACAQEISSLLTGAKQGKVSVDGRALQGSDIAVLVRSHREGEQIRAALLCVGVLSVSIAQDSVHQSPDALDLERVLSAVLEPANPMRLRLALSTDLIGESAESIAGLDRDDASLSVWTERLHEWQRIWLSKGIASMIRRLMLDVAVASRWLVRSDGERRLTNLQHLLERLQEAARIYPQPASLWAWLVRERTQGFPSEATVLRLESDRDLVKVLTIHRSKGLEFPVVFCPFLWASTAQASTFDIASGASYHDENGKVVIDRRSFSERGEDALAIKSRIQTERAAEIVRLIYVALTRASQRIYLVCGQTLMGDRRQPAATRARAGSATVLNWLVSGASSEFEPWLSEGAQPAEVDRAWLALVQSDPESITEVPITLSEDVNTTQGGERTNAQFEALPVPRFRTAGWQMGSYSSLVLGSHQELEADDHDQFARAAVSRQNQTVVPKTDVLNFPRGASAGICIHALLEHLDFTRPALWPQGIERCLNDFPPTQGRDHTAESLKLWGAQLSDMLRDIMRTPLPTGFQLSQVRSEHRLNELEFMLPSEDLTPKSLKSLLLRHGESLQIPEFEPLRGYLRGFIDLVFMHNGRYYVLDWKSNHLGELQEDYSPPRLAEVMAEQHYDLQALIYCCVLHRYLQRRLPRYTYEQHFGGALYVFVRGLRPAWAESSTSVCGVHFYKPCEGLLHDLRSLLDPTDGSALAPPLKDRELFA